MIWPLWQLILVGVAWLVCIVGIVGAIAYGINVAQDEDEEC
jgi:hypothetical protein